MCSDHLTQVGSEYRFAKIKCITGTCQSCGEEVLEDSIKRSNEELLKQKKQMAWRQWMTLAGKSTPAKCQVKGSLQQAIDQLIDMTASLKCHLFRANWHKNVFEEARKNVPAGHIIQIFDFAMNFWNLCQDEIQSAH